MVLPEYAQLFTSPEGFTEVMAAYDAEITRGPIPYRSRMVSTRYGDTHILSGGSVSGPPLFLFHSWYANASTIGTAFHFLFSLYHVYMPDIIGQMGKSASTRPPTRGPAYAEWVSDLYQELGIHKAVVIGVAGGSWVTLKLASYAPHLVDKAIVVTPVGLAPYRSIAHHLRYILFSRLAGLMNSSKGRRWAARHISGPLLKGAPFECFADTLSRNHRVFQGPVLPGTLSDKELRKITAPILIMVGACDQHFNPFTIQARARRLIPGERDVLIFPHVGHLLMEEKPEDARSYILDFLLTPKEPHKTNPTPFVKRKSLWGSLLNCL